MSINIVNLTFNRLTQTQEEENSKEFTYLAESNVLESMVERNSTSSQETNYEYDATGNIVKDNRHSYTYDGRNRLVKVDNNVTYQYNYDNKRVSKRVNNKTTYYIYDGHMLVGEYTQNKEQSKEYIYHNSSPIAVTDNSTTYRVYADHLNTSRRVATNNKEAKLLWEWESKPFGESPANEDVDQDSKKFTLNLRFPGQYFDKETQTHYNINRDYNPVTGRYIQSDPIGFDGGVNGFGYVGGMPIRLSDSSGLCIDPGGQGVRYCIDAFISQDWIGARQHRGDNRGSSAYISNGEDYRARVLIANYGAGYDFYPAIGVSHDSSGNSMAGNLDNWASVTDNDNLFSFYVETSNALAQASLPNWLKWAVPSVKLDITIEGSKVSGTRTSFPSLEIWMYTDSYAVELYYYDAGHWYDSPLWLATSVENFSGGW